MLCLTAIDVCCAVQIRKGDTTPLISQAQALALVISQYQDTWEERQAQAKREQQQPKAKAKEAGPHQGQGQRQAPAGGAEAGPATDVDEERGEITAARGAQLV